MSEISPDAPVFFSFSDAEAGTGVISRTTTAGKIRDADCGDWDVRPQGEDFVIEVGDRESFDELCISVFGQNDEIPISDLDEANNEI